MKSSMESIYEQILVTESQNRDLTNPKHSTVSNLKQNQDVFGEKPDLVKGPDSAKLAQGPSHKISTSSETAPVYSKGSKFKGSAPAKQQDTEEPSETETPDSSFSEENDETDSSDEPNEDQKNKKKNNSTEEKDEENNKYIKQNENFTMSAFENLFKKTLNEDIEANETNEIDEVADDTMSPSDSEDTLPEDETIADEDETEEDLISDLRELQTKLDSILTKLEGMEDEENESEEGGDESYSDEDFDNEFTEDETVEGEEGAVRKESLDKPKLLSNAKGKQLLNKKNKVGKLAPKGGKAHSGKFKYEPAPKSISSKAASLSKGNSQVKSSVKKGDFIK